MTALPDRRSPCRIDRGKGNKRHRCGTGDAVEQRLTLKDWLTGHRDPARQEIAA